MTLSDAEWVVSVPRFWTPDGDFFVTYEQMQADPDLRRRCLAWELGEVVNALSRTVHEPAFEPIRSAVLKTAEDVGAADEFRALVQSRQDTE